jgi:parallel beta-helix repeat protein
MSEFSHSLTMKSLDQIEARTPISSLPYTITNPGSYYVTANLTGVSGSDGIDIATNNVTLDLNGFTLHGAGAGEGINVVNPAKNVAIRNGVVDSWSGVGVNALNAYNSQFERLCSSSNLDGLYVGSNSVVLVCTASQIRNIGIYAVNNNTFKDCVASASSSGFYLGNNNTLIGCTASGNGDGFSAGNNSTFKDCNASGNGAGFYVANNSVIKDCNASGSATYGIYVGNNSAVKDCIASGNSTYGIYVPNYNCQITGDTCSGNSSYGIYILGNYNVVKDCNASGNLSDGIHVPGYNCQIFGNICSGNSAYGIYVVGNQNRVDGNSAANNSSYGIGVATNNVDNNITRNFAPGNVLGGYYNFTGNNDYAPLGSPNSSANPWQNFQ